MRVNLAMSGRAAVVVAMTALDDVAGIRRKA